MGTDQGVLIKGTVNLKLIVIDDGSISR